MRLVTRIFLFAIFVKKSLITSVFTPLVCSFLLYKKKKHIINYKLRACVKARVFTCLFICAYVYVYTCVGVAYSRTFQTHTRVCVCLLVCVYVCCTDLSGPVSQVQGGSLMCMASGCSRRATRSLVISRATSCSITPAITQRC